MKFTVDIDDPMIETYGYDGEPDGEVDFSLKDYLFSEMTKSMNARFKTGNIEKLINAKIDNRIDGMVKDSLIDQISKLSDRFMDEYLDREIQVTDDYGHVKYEGTLRDKVHSKFDEYMKQQVDKNGHSSDSRYNTTYSRSEFLINKILDDKMKDFTEKTIKNVRESIEKKLSGELELAVGKGIVDSIGIPKLIENIKL